MHCNSQNIRGIEADIRNEFYEINKIVDSVRSHQPKVTELVDRGD